MKTILFNSTTRLRDVMRSFLKLRLKKTTISDDEMKEYALVRITSVNSALPLDKTIQECKLVDNTHIESTYMNLSVMSSSIN